MSCFRNDTQMLVYYLVLCYQMLSLTLPLSCSLPLSNFLSFTKLLKFYFLFEVVLPITAFSFQYFIAAACKLYNNNTSFAVNVCVCTFALVHFLFTVHSMKAHNNAEQYLKICKSLRKCCSFFVVPRVFTFFLLFGNFCTQFLAFSILITYLPLFFFAILVFSF